jgi:hypothetical protein
MDKLYILGNPGDKVKISLVGRAQRVRWGQTNFDAGSDHPMILA